MMVVDVTTAPTFNAGKPRMLFTGAYRADPIGHPLYDMTPDGQRFVMSQEVRDEALAQVNIVLNWSEELKRLVPTEN